MKSFQFSYITDELIRKLSANPKETDPLASADGPGRDPLPKEDHTERYFSLFLKFLSDVDMEEDEAGYHYERIVEHTKEMEEIHGRTVGFRVGMLDYLLNINPRLESPKVIEMKTFESMLEQSTLDGLTGLFNRGYFENQLHKELNRAKRYDQTFSIVLVDLDDFKKINDTYGHVIGDKVLQEFASLLKNRLRVEDIAARYGGEEFIMLLPQTDIDGAKGFTERLLDATRGYGYGQGVKVTFSGGIANFPHHAYTGKELEVIADKGLYASKLRGKDSVTVLDEERRDTRRYRTNAQMLFSAESRKLHQGKIRNISISGLQGETEIVLEAGQFINLKFSDQESDSDYDIQAQIVWINKRNETEPVLFGAKYAAENRSLVYQAVDQLIPEDPEEADEQLSLF